MSEKAIPKTSPTFRERKTISSVNSKTVDSAASDERIALRQAKIEVRTAGASAAEAKVYDGDTTGTVVASLKADQRHQPDSGIIVPMPTFGTGNSITVSVEGDSTADVLFDLGYYKDLRPSG